MARRPLIIVTWLWGSKYSLGYVDRLHAACRRHVAEPFRFFLMTERERAPFSRPTIERHAIKDPHLIGRGCFCRLRLFDVNWQRNRKIEPGSRVLNLDLDDVIVGDLTPLLDRDDSFTILQGVNSSNPCRFNASMFMLTAGTNAHVWEEFSLEAAARTSFHEFPDDQGWMDEMMPDAAAWGPKDGVYAFRKPGWPKGDELPANARVVAFPGRRDPSQFLNLPWVQRNWAGSNEMA